MQAASCSIKLTPEYMALNFEHKHSNATIKAESAIITPGKPAFNSLMTDKDLKYNALITKMKAERKQT